MAILATKRRKDKKGCGIMKNKLALAIIVVLLALSWVPGLSEGSNSTNDVEDTFFGDWDVTSVEMYDEPNAFAFEELGFKFVTIKAGSIDIFTEDREKLCSLRTLFDGENLAIVIPESEEKGMLSFRDDGILDFHIPFMFGMWLEYDYDIRNVFTNMEVNVAEECDILLQKNEDAGSNGADWLG